MKPSYEFHRRGPFVLPDTPGGRRIIRRALRKSLHGQFCDSRESAGVATPGRTPVFEGSTCQTIGRARYYRFGTRSYFGHELFFSGDRDGYAEDALQLNANFSRVNVCASTGPRTYSLDDAFAARLEWADCCRAARDPRFHLTKEDKATIETMRAAIERERLLVPERMAEIERERNERFDRELRAFTDNRLDQFRAVNPHALLLILCVIQFRCARYVAVAKAFPHTRGWTRQRRSDLACKLIGKDSQADQMLERLDSVNAWIKLAEENRRIRPTSSVFRHITDKTRWLLSPAGLDAIRAEVDALPRIHIEKSNRGRRPPSRRSQLLALGIPA